MTAEFALGADFARHARHLRGDDAKLLDHRVDNRRRPQELAHQRAPIDIKPYRLQQIALGDGGNRLRHLGGRPQQIVDQRVDRGLHFAPGAIGEAQLDALADLALPAHDLADCFQLACQHLIGRDDLIERLGDLAFDTVSANWQANGEVADTHGLKRLMQVMQGGAAVQAGGLIDCRARRIDHAV